MHISRKILGIKNKGRFAQRIKTEMVWLFRAFLSFVLIPYSLFSCRGDEVIYPTIDTHVADEVRGGGLYVLCEGNMGSNKARLDYMNLATGTYYANWYGSQNPTQLKELGDVGNDIKQHGGRLYAVINCSHKVEVMDLQARHIAKIDIPNCRYLAFKGDKMYVSAYVGSVATPELLGSVFEIDTATLAVTREVKVGHQPDELCIVDDKLYVCNSGGYLTNRYDSTLSVIDLHSFTELRKIPVGLNPTRVRVDDQKHLWVTCQGNYSSVKPQIVILENEQPVYRIPTPCANISLLGANAYVIDAENNELKVFSTIDYQRSPSERGLGGVLSSMEHPYGLLATSDALYITDAKNYVSSGVLYCFGYDGVKRWSAQTGDIPGHLCRVTEEFALDEDSTATKQHSAYLKTVYEYLPAMGQFVNVLPKYEEGDDAASMCRKCEQAIANNAGGMVCLGGWGGYITFGFDHPVENKDGYDLRILGNAFAMSGNTAYGSSEPGIVLVSRDENGNGLPDDTWYELKGSMYDDPATRHNVTKTYSRASDTVRNTFHTQPYYPQWIKEESLTFTGALLPPQTETISGQSVQRILDYGYVDNKPNSDIEGTSFDISWAIDTDGKSISLPCVDFIRVYTAVDENNGPTGELSTEITGAIDLHITTD